MEKQSSENLVFFDFLGAFVIRWPMTVADIINFLSVIFSLYSITVNAKEAEFSDSKKFRTHLNSI